MGLPFACFKYFMYINERVVGVGGGKAEQVERQGAARDDAMETY